MIFDNWKDANCLDCNRPATGPDGLCDKHRKQAPVADEGFEGGECTRCGLSLVEGLCPNDRCPFANTFQDELVEAWTYPDEEESAHIETLRV